MKKLHHILLFLTIGFSASNVLAQQGFYLGPALGVGVNYSKNFIIEPESPYYIENNSGLYAFGGLDLAFALDEYTGFHVGVNYGYKQYNLSPPGTVEGLSFETLTTNASTISIPVMVHQRIPLNDTRKTWFTLMAGLSIDMVQGDSTVFLSAASPVDSGGSVFRHTIIHVDQTLPTVLLGAGLDFTLGSGSLLNITAMWSPGTAIVTKGDIREWESINQTFDPFQANEPQEFPDHYFDFGMRGSTFALRLSYMFNLGNPFEKKSDAFED